MKNVDVSLKEAQATFELIPGQKLRPEILRKVVADAGFTPRDIFITVRGALLQKEGIATFQPFGSAQTFTLIKNEELNILKGENLTEVDLVARVMGETSPYSLEVQKYQK